MEAAKEDLASLLVWSNGVGHLPLENGDYASYVDFLKGREKEKDAVYRGMVRERIKMIRRTVFSNEHVLKCLDVYIGGGLFIREMNSKTDIETSGLDVSVYALRWLKSNEYESVGDVYDILTFWDAFDQIPGPHLYIKDYKPRYVAVSVPIYHSKEQIVSSPYFNTSKRFWFFTKLGLIKWMGDLDFSLVTCDNQEDIRFGMDRYQTFIFAANTKHKAIYG